MDIINENRRDFLKKAAISAASLALLANCRYEAAAQKTDESLLALIRKNGVDDNWTGAKEVPGSVSWRTVLSKETDKGEPIEISGTVFQPDGKTPAPNTLIYLYHTDFEGYYGRGVGHRHGRYRGWMLTDKAGNYSFRTIKPAPYPENRWAAHIHMTVTTVKLREDSIDSILFEGDRLISPQERQIHKGGFNAILSFEKSRDGLLRATRNIQLVA
ncbi:MAG TPA: twin-arginine translocation signal domain-containing protein [Pyrinomonadaceae bacterium]|nr:twin-arginine translocation signal domain-containing protein [Pyrinomonadaceae bacterium]